MIVLWKTKEEFELTCGLDMNLTIGAVYRGQDLVELGWELILALLEDGIDVPDGADPVNFLDSCYYWEPMGSDYFMVIAVKMKYVKE